MLYILQYFTIYACPPPPFFYTSSDNKKELLNVCTLAINIHIYIINISIYQIRNNKKNHYHHEQKCT